MRDAGIGTYSSPMSFLPPRKHSKPRPCLSFSLGDNTVCSWMWVWRCGKLNILNHCRVKAKYMQEMINPVTPIVRKHIEDAQREQ